MGWARLGILLTAFWVCLLEALLSGLLLAGLYELQAPGGQWLNAWFYGLFLLKILCCQSIGLWLLAFFISAPGTWRCIYGCWRCCLCSMPGLGCGYCQVWLNSSFCLSGLFCGCCSFAAAICRCKRYGV